MNLYNPNPTILHRLQDQACYESGVISQNTLDCTH